MNQKTRLPTPRVIAQVLLFLVLVPFLPLLISWQWDWWQAWVYAIISILGFAISRAIASQRHPGLLAERGRFLDHEDAKPWDKTLAPLVGLGGALVPLVAGLDALFGWPPDFGLGVEMVGLALLLAGYALASYALIENAYFSGMVRIQSDRLIIRTRLEDQTLQAELDGYRNYAQRVRYRLLPPVW